MRKKRAPKKVSIITVSQSIFLTLKYFLENRLFSYASACSFNFLFSIVPIFVTIALILIKILHASPKMVASILSLSPEIQNYIDASYVINLVQSMKFAHSFEIFITVFILWMARRFFASVTDSLQNIFHNKTRRKAFLNQIFTFLVELFTISTVSALLFFYFSLAAINFFDFIFGFMQNIPVLSFIFKNWESVNLLPDFLIFAVVTILYKGNSGTRPRVSLCAFAGFLCTLSFKIFRAAMNAIMNVANYNLLYGVLSHVIILLMEIFFFFVFFLFFAQMIFSIQFFDELLLGELYLLPKVDKKGLGGKIKRLLFIRPDFLVASGSKTVHVDSGGEIFELGGKPKYIYYIAKGSVALSFAKDVKVLKRRGEFFGEVDCVLNQRRNCSATATSDTELVEIEALSFKFLINQNQQASRKILRKLMARKDAGE